MEIKKIKEYLELAEKSTPGPWDYPAKHGDCYVCFGEIVDGSIKKAITHQQNEMVLAEPNLKFIAASRTMGPALAKALIIADERLAKLETFCTWLCEDSRKYPGTDAGNAAKIERIDIRRARADIEKILSE